MHAHNWYYAATSADLYLYRVRGRAFSVPQNAGYLITRGNATVILLTATYSWIRRERNQPRFEVDVGTAVMRQSSCHVWGLQDQSWHAGSASIRLR